MIFPLLYCLIIFVRIGVGVGISTVVVIISALHRLCVSVYDYFLSF